MSVDTARTSSQHGSELVGTKHGDLSHRRLSFGVDDRIVDRICATLALTGITALMIRRWIVIGPYPPGLDGAQWLALGRGLHGPGRSSEGAYAPLTPLLASAAEALVGPLPALRLLAITSSLALILAIWLVARLILGPVWGFASAAIVIPASALSEPLFYGGYPQQFALAAGVVSLWGVCQYLAVGDKRLLISVGITALIAAAAHHIYFPLMLLSMLSAIGLWFSVGSNRLRWKAVVSLVLSLVPAMTLSAVVTSNFVAAGYRAPLDASARAPLEAWRYATRESPELWLVLLTLAMAILATSWRSRALPPWLLSASLIIPAGVLTLISGQPRLLPPLLVGVALAIGFGAKRVAATWRLATPAALLTIAVFAAVLLVPADRAATGFAGFYRVVDEPLLQAAEAITSDGGAGAVAVRQDHRGWPIGWWFEALLSQPILVGSDRKWLAFPDERQRALQAAAIFDGGLDAATFKAYASTAEIRYLVVPKWDWIGWERWTSNPEFPVIVVFDDDRYLVLRVAE